MHMLLAPAVALLNRLSFRGKFAVIIFCVLIALASLGGSLGTTLWSEIRHTRNEQAGVAALVPTLHAVQMIQQHRGQMVSVLSGKPELKARIEFRQVNLNASLPDLGVFDLIFLRNVMIYFDTETKRKVVGNLLPRLKSGGHLIIGHAETLNGIQQGLEPVRATIYRKP